MRCFAGVILVVASWLFFLSGLQPARGCTPAGEKATAEILRCHENGCAEGTLECGGLTPPSPLGLHAGDTLRRRQAAALQGASRIFMHGGDPKDHEVYAQNDKADRLFYAFSGFRAQTAAPAQAQPLPGVAEAVNKGFDLLSRNDAAGAEAAFRKAIDLQPELEMAHRGLGLALRARGQDEAAVRELQVATRLDPADADAHYALAMTSWALTNQPSASPRAKGAALPDYAGLAAGEFRKLAALRPQDASLRLILTEIDLQVGRKEDALSDAQEAVRLAPDNSRVHVALGRAYFAGAEEDKAAAEYEKALKLNPKEGEAYLALGQIRFFQRRYAQAEENFQQAIQVSPNLAPAYAGMAKIFLQQARSAEARSMLEKVVALDPQDWESQYQLAVLLNEAGEAGAATDLLEKVTRLHPDFLPAQEQLVMGLVRRGELKQASAKAGVLVAEQPQAAEGHRLLALILRRQHDLEGALAEAAMALGPEPDSASMLALQAICLWQLQRKKDALAAFREAARLEPKVGTPEVFCRLVLCDAPDIGTVSDFLHRNRWAITPTPQP